MRKERRKKKQESKLLGSLLHDDMPLGANVYHLLSAVFYEIK